MKIKSNIGFRIEDPEIAWKILGDLGLNVNYEHPYQTALLFKDDPKYELLINRLVKKNIQYSEIFEMFFDDDELDKAEYYYLGLAGYWGYPQPMDEFEYLKESYDESAACPICGNGAKQVRPFLIKGKPKFGRNDILAINWEFEFLITEKLKALIEKEELTGVEFWPLLDYKKRTSVEGFHQLYVTNELPPMSPNMEFETDDLGPNPKIKLPCPCNKIGRNLAVHQMRYKRNDIEKAKDFNKTHEWIGGTYHTTQWTVVSKRVYQLFKKNNIKRVKFAPILVEAAQA